MSVCQSCKGLFTGLQLYLCLICRQRLKLWDYSDHETFSDWRQSQRHELERKHAVLA